MKSSLLIAEKPSVARQFSETLAHKEGKVFSNKTGYMEAEDTIITWCVGHLVTMSYPEKYENFPQKWSLEPLPFIPDTFKYEIISSAKKQYEIVKSLLLRDDVDTIYVCTDSGREGEYIYRLVEQMSGVSGKKRRRVWIDSQTEDEIMRGIREAKDLSEYDNLSDAAYLRAKEDYLMGINFSRALTLKYRYTLQDGLGVDKVTISVGRVMTCVLGMVVTRERDIRNFKKTPFYRVMAQMMIGQVPVTAEWKSAPGSDYENSPLLYKENGFSKKEDAQNLIDKLLLPAPLEFVLEKSEKKKEVKKPLLFYNLAELQNDCSRLFKLSPDQTLSIAQELYEKKFTTYPRTDARVLSTAVAKEITKNIKPLAAYLGMEPFVRYILEKKTYVGLEKTKYVNDKQITDHYAIIPTGDQIDKAGSLSEIAGKVYELILRRFLAVFCPDAVYQKVALIVKRGNESFFANFKVQTEAGYQKVFSDAFFKKAKPEGGTNAGKDGSADGDEDKAEGTGSSDNNEKLEEVICDENFINLLSSLKKGAIIEGRGFEIKEGETSPPKRYNSGSMILAMENAGQLIEDEELRAQIKGSGIGTSATRAEILKKLVNIGYLSLNKKTQIYTPTYLGESIFYVVGCCMPMLLAPKMTASWEMGLSMVADGEITADEYMVKLSDFIKKRIDQVKNTDEKSRIRSLLLQTSVYYKNGKEGNGSRRKNTGSNSGRKKPYKKTNAAEGKKSVDDQDK